MLKIVQIQWFLVPFFGGFFELNPLRSLTHNLQCLDPVSSCKNVFSTSWASCGFSSRKVRDRFESARTGSCQVRARFVLLRANPCSNPCQIVPGSCKSKRDLAFRSKDRSHIPRRAVFLSVGWNLGNTVPCRHSFPPFCTH